MIRPTLSATEFKIFKQVSLACLSKDHLVPSKCGRAPSEMADAIYDARPATLVSVGQL